MEPLVVNLFGVPSAGKSTGAAYIFSKLKMNGVNAELVTEYAKEKVWENNAEALKNQVYVFGEQCYRQDRCKDKVDVIVTDSPLPLSIFYNRDHRLNQCFNQTVMDVFNSYNNINYCITRVKPYNPVGRCQNESESDLMSEPMVKLLVDNNIEFTYKKGDEWDYNEIVAEVMSKLKEYQDSHTENSL